MTTHPGTAHRHAHDAARHRVAAGEAGAASDLQRVLRATLADLDRTRATALAARVPTPTHSTEDHR